MFRVPFLIVKKVPWICYKIGQMHSFISDLIKLFSILLSIKIVQDFVGTNNYNSSYYTVLLYTKRARLENKTVSYLF